MPLVAACKSVNSMEFMLVLASLFEVLEPAIVSNHWYTAIMSNSWTQLNLLGCVHSALAAPPSPSLLTVHGRGVLTTLTCAMHLLGNSNQIVATLAAICSIFVWLRTCFILRGYPETAKLVAMVIQIMCVEV